MLSVRIAFALSFALMLGLVVYGQSDLKPSGLVVNGQPVSVVETKRSLEEVKSLGGALKGDYNTDVSRVEAQTRMGRLAKEMIAGIQSVERWHQDAIKDFSMDELMDAKAMRSRESIEAAMSRLAEFERIEAEHVKRRTAKLVAFAEGIGNSPTVVSKMAESRALLDGFLESERTVFRAVREYLRFGLDNPHEVDESKGVVYWDDGDLPRAKALLEDIEARQAELRTKIAEVEGKAQKSLESLANA